MFRRPRYVFPFLSIVLGSCATFPPPEERRPEADPDLLAADDSPTTAEWLFVTAEGKGRGGSKCEAVAAWLEGETPCTGEICTHARDLGREWLTRCKTEVPAKLSTVQELVGQFEERADLAPDACIREGTGLLRTQECGEPAVCETQAQKWIARCGTSYATPLFILMLTRTLQRRFPDDPNQPAHKVEFDPRSCDALSEAVGTGVGCDGDACAPAVKAGEAWMDRCFDQDNKVPMVLAYRMADVRVGGGHGVDPIPVSPLDARLPQGTFPLQLADGTGVVTWACGVRPGTLDGYLKTRKDCRPGEVIVARMDGKRQVRVVSVPHADDETFGRLFPFLGVKGEREARDLEEIESFRALLAEAVDAAQGSRPERAIGVLTRALRPRDWVVARQPAYQRILTDADAALVTAFGEWGKLKVKSAARARGEEQALFAGRALQNPLHDMTTNGSVEVGGYVAPWPMTMDRWMPLSFMAYRDSIEQLERTASRNRPSDDRLNDLRGQVRIQIRACSQAEASIKATSAEVMDCMSLEGGCTQDRIATLATKADPDRQQATRARAAILRILATGVFSRAEVERLESERVTSGCLDP
jgi:hypothetical protein